MADDIQEQLIDLQTRLAFQEHTIEELDNTIIAQQRQIDLLLREIELLKKRVERQEQQGDEETSPFDPAVERPPHY